MRKYVIFIALSLGLLTISISGSTVAVAFPIIASELKTTLILAGWVLSIVQLVGAISMPLAGKISDILGRKFIFSASLVLFIVGSIICALSPNITVLIFARLLQGIGGGALLPSATGLAVEEFPNSRQQTIGFFSSIFAIGQIIGPNAGGWLVETFGWRSVFWFSVPFALIVLIAGLYILQPSKRVTGKIDLLGAGLLSGFISTFLVGLSMLGNADQISWLSFGIFMALSAVFLIIFIRRESKTDNPIIDLPILTQKPFIAANIYNFMLGATVFGIMSFMPLYAVSIFNMSTFASGAILTPRSVAVIIASLIMSIFIFRTGYRKPMVAGTIIVVISLILLGIEPATITFLNTSSYSVAALAAIIFLIGLGMGTVMPASNNACIELMPERVATITGIRGMFRQFGGAISITISSLVLQIFQNDMALGFVIIYMGLAVLLLITIPVIFLMPSSATVIGHNELTHK